MKKIILSYIVVLGICLTASAQIQGENFDAGTIPSGWSATAGPTGCAWAFGYTDSIPGSGFTNPASFTSGGAVFNDNACGTGVSNTVQLEGPSIDLVASGVTSAAIEIIYNHQAFAGDGNFLVDVWDGSAWQNVLTVDDDSPITNSGTNQTSVIDVTSHINAAFKVRFVYDDENELTWGLGIDDYKLMDTATAGVEDLLGAGFTYSPNPIVEDVLTLNANEDISIVNIYNTIGQKVIGLKPITTKSEVPMQNLPEGVYIVNVAIGEREGSFKVIKK